MTSHPFGQAIGRQDLGIRCRRNVPHQQDRLRQHRGRGDERQRVRKRARCARVSRGASNDRDALRGQRRQSEDNQDLIAGEYPDSVELGNVLKEASQTRTALVSETQIEPYGDQRDREPRCDGVDGQ